METLETEQEKAGAIQAFECCFELSWKIMKRLLQVRGRIANSPKETFRMAALENFIDDPELWYDFLEMRNLTVHTYQEAQADKIIQILPEFSKAIQCFLKSIGVEDA
jgi:nucleotidyltransferase substrate binding protein (TIGR01987 family)